MSPSEAANISVKAINSLGSATLNAMYPDDFEYYMIALELTTFTGDLVDYFCFPVMPNSIQKIEQSLTNIRKTAGGISIIKTDYFNPQDLIIQGDFGRKFKILLGRDSIDFNAFRYSGIGSKEIFKSKQSTPKPAQFDLAVKTGYGCFKILQSICDKSTLSDDEGKPLLLNMYNMALGESYRVEVVSFSPKMSLDRNRIHQYELRVSIVANLEVSPVTKNIIGMSLLQKTADNISSSITRELIAI